MMDSNYFVTMRTCAYGLWLLGVGWLFNGCQLMARSEPGRNPELVERTVLLSADSSDGEIERVVNLYLDWTESNTSRFEYQHEDSTRNDEYGMLHIPADSIHPAIAVDPTGMTVDDTYLSYNSYTQRRARIILKRAKVQHLRARLN